MGKKPQKLNSAHWRVRYLRLPKLKRRYRRIAIKKSAGGFFGWPYVLRWEWAEKEPAHAPVDGEALAEMFEIVLASLEAEGFHLHSIQPVSEAAPPFLPGKLAAQPGRGWNLPLPAGGIAGYLVIACRREDPQE